MPDRRAPWRHETRVPLIVQSRYDAVRQKPLSNQRQTTFGSPGWAHLLGLPLSSRSVRIEWSVYYMYYRLICEKKYELNHITRGICEVGVYTRLPQVTNSPMMPVFRLTLDRIRSGRRKRKRPRKEECLRYLFEEEAI